LITSQNSTGFLFSVDTRVKWVGVFMVAFVVLTVPLFTWAVYILLFSVLTAMAISSCLPLRQVFKRAFLIEVPLVLILIPLPFLNQTAPLKALDWWGITLHISWSELLRVGVLMLRSWLIIFSMVLFTLTTPAGELLTSLSDLHVPAVLVTVISLMWRYLALFVDDSQKMVAARELRSVPARRGKAGRFAQNIKSAGSILGSLFIRAYDQSERIYQAMQLRGFDGTLRSWKKEPLQNAQKLQMLALLMVGILFIMGAYGIDGK
jgi:cobalt/nickel transport system permease protein